MDKNILNITYEFRFKLIGIVSPEKAYRLCWALNKELKLNLVSINDITRITDLKGEIYFPCYRQLNSYGERDYDLIANQAYNCFFIPEQKNIDFFFLCYNLETEINITLGQMHRMKLIHAALPINPKKLKSGENLLL